MPMDMSYADARSLIEGHLNKDKGDDDQYFWVKDIFDDTVVYEDDGVLYQATYTITDGEVTLGTPERVKTTYEKFAELAGVEVLRTGKFVSADGRDVTFTEADLDEVHGNFKDIPTNKIPISVSHAEGDESDLINAMTVGAPVMSYMKELVKKTVAGVPRLIADFGDIPEKAVDMIGNQLVRISPEVFTNFIDNDGVAHGKAFKRISFVDRSSIRELPDVTQANLVFDEGSGQESLVLFLHEDGGGNNNQGGKKEMDEKLRKMQEAIDGFEVKFKDQGLELVELRAERDSLKEKAEAATTKLSEQALAAHKKGISDFMEQLKADARISPAMEPALQSFMEALPHGEKSGTIKFGEPGKEKEFDALGMFQEMLSGQKPLLMFGELGKDDEPIVASGDVEELIEKYQEAHPDVSYREASSAVSKKHPELFR